MNYYICSLSPKFPENYQIGTHANVWGVERKYEHRIRPAQPGDNLLFVMKGEFISVHKIESEYYFDEKSLWPPKDGDLFPYRITISDPFIAGSAQIKGNLQHKISFMKNKVWGGTLQGAAGVFNNRLTSEDFDIIKAEMENTPPSDYHIKKKPLDTHASQTNNKTAVRKPALSPVSTTPKFKFYEKDIEDRLIPILGELGLKLYTDENTGKTGKQFVIDGGRIDLLCVDNQTNDFVIIELKKGDAPIETLLQILKYMSWVKQHMAQKPKRSVRGIILTEGADPGLAEYLEEVPNVSLQYYKVSISLT